MSKGSRLRFILACVLAGLVIPVAPAFAPCHIITFEGDPYSVAEGAGEVTITVSKNGPQGEPTVDYITVSDSADAGSDFEGTSGTLVISDTEATFDVEISDDSSDERNERFMVRLSNATDGGCPLAVGIQEDTATITIRDDDVAPTPTPTPTPTKTTPKPKPSTPSASPSASPAETSPSPDATTSPVAAPGSGDGGLSGGAIAGIVAATLVLGGAAAFWVRRRFLT